MRDWNKGLAGGISEPFAERVLLRTGGI